MPRTTLKLEDDKKVTFITNQTDQKGLNVSIYMCDIDFIPMGQPLTMTLEADEQEYHSKLRKDAASRGHFMPGHSTNSEWND